MKKYILWLFLSFVWFFAFCNSESITLTSLNNDWYTPNSFVVWKSISTSSFNFIDLSCSYGACELEIRNLYWAGRCVYSTLWWNTCNSNKIFSASGFKFSTTSNYFDNITITWFDLSSSCPECETCPEINTWDILSWFCDTNYCVENDLCPVPSNFSQLFINDLEFPWTPIINVNIPDYIHWDYSSNETGFDLYVGSGYDQDYIDSVLKINSYRPDSSDFTNIFVSGLTLLFPYLIFALFLVFMWKLIKRIFKH